MNSLLCERNIFFSTSQMSLSRDFEAWKKLHGNTSHPQCDFKTSLEWNRSLEKSKRKSFVQTLLSNFGCLRAAIDEKNNLILYYILEEAF